MSTELTETTGTEVTKPIDHEEDYGATEGLTAEDITLGRVLTMNALSDLVKAETHKQGQLVNSLTEEVLGYKDEPMEFIAFMQKKYWIEKENDDFRGIFPATSPTELPWQDGAISRVFTHAFYILLPEEIESGMAMPLELAFRSTDLGTARKLSAYFMQLRKMRKASWAKTFKLTTVMKQKDKHSWYGTKLGVGRDTTEAEVKEAKSWKDMLKNDNAAIEKAVRQEVEREIPSSAYEDTEVDF